MSVNSQSYDLLLFKLIAYIYSWSDIFSNPGYQQNPPDLHKLFVRFSQSKSFNIFRIFDEYERLHAFGSHAIYNIRVRVYIYIYIYIYMYICIYVYIVISICNSMISSAICTNEVFKDLKIHLIIHSFVSTTEVKQCILITKIVNLHCSLKLHCCQPMRIEQFFYVYI